MASQTGQKVTRSRVHVLGAKTRASHTPRRWNFSSFDAHWLIDTGNLKLTQPSDKTADLLWRNREQLVTVQLVHDKGRPGAETLPLVQLLILMANYVATTFTLPHPEWQSMFLTLANTHTVPLHSTWLSNLPVDSI